MRIEDKPHRRYNPLAGEWVLVSPHRTQRPWQGQVEKKATEALDPYDSSCYLCPGNERAGGKKNPVYEGIFTFINDFSALLQDTPAAAMNEKGLLIAESERGRCEVICFSPRHDLTLPRMDVGDIEKVVQVWKERYQALEKDPDISYVQIFENRGAVMGCSNPHPHGQIWATQRLPDLPAKEDRMQREYLGKQGRCLLCDYVALELEKEERIIFQNEVFAALVPFWAVWPYEVMILPKKHLSSLDGLNRAETAALADMLKRMGIRYDNLFQTSFPYSMGIHQRPVKADPEAQNSEADREIQRQAWHFHLHYLPPLLRSATVRKFMVGFELLAMPQRDITAESAAAQLRSLPETHYLEEEA